MSFSKIFGGAKIIPVATFNDPEQAVRTARKLAAEGMPAVEVTLRTQRGLDCIRAIATALPNVIVGAGTVLTPLQMDDAAKAACVAVRAAPGTGPVALDDFYLAEPGDTVADGSPGLIQNDLFGVGQFPTAQLVTPPTNGVLQGGLQADGSFTYVPNNASVTGDSFTYRIQNAAQLLATQSQTAQTFTTLLGTVAGISLLVGGLGVTNIMLVTVTERTREIGIRKAIGAPKGVILGQFLAESTLLSLVGGGLGVVAGLIGSHFRIVGIKPVVIPESVWGAFAIAVAIGLFFGSYPANRAASLRPIEALRHE